VSVLDLRVHDLISSACSMQSGFNSVGVSCSTMSDVSSNGGKYGRRQSTLNTGCKPRNGGMLSSKDYPYSLGDGVWPISKRANLAVGPSEVLLLQM
jgi:hypothetical protein